MARLAHGARERRPRLKAVGASTGEAGLVASAHAPLLAAFAGRVLHLGILEPQALWILAILPLAGLTILRRTNHRRHPAGTASRQRGIPDRRSVLCRSILAFGSAALVSLAALWFFHRIYRGEGAEASQVPAELLLLCTVVVIVTNLAVSVVFHDSRRRAFGASLVAALVLLGAGQLLGGTGAGLPARIMEKFGFGGGRATVVLTEKGGRLLCRHSVPVELAEPRQSAAGTPQPSETGPYARATGLEILSRLGSQFVLRSGGARGQVIAVPKSEVVSWSAGPGPSVQNDCPPPPPVVTPPARPARARG